MLADKPDRAARGFARVQFADLDHIKGRRLIVWVELHREAETQKAWHNDWKISSSQRQISQGSGLTSVHNEMAWLEKEGFVKTVFKSKDRGKPSVYQLNGPQLSGGQPSEYDRPKTRILKGDPVSCANSDLQRALDALNAGAREAAKRQGIGFDAIDLDRKRSVKLARLLNARGIDYLERAFSADAIYASDWHMGRKGGGSKLTFPALTHEDQIVKLYNGLKDSGTREAFTSSGRNESNPGCEID